jgi:3-oxoacyl-[acyl-carrier-protein] synthase II
MRVVNRETRLAITGVGILCSVGSNQQQVWESIVASRGGVAPLKGFPGETFPTDIAAEVADRLDRLDGLSGRQVRRLSRTDRMAVVAAKEALDQAGRAGEPLNLKRAVVSTGTSTGGLLEGENYFFRRLDRGHHRTAVSRVLQQPTSAPSDAVAQAFGFGGGVVSNATACASGGAAIGLAADMIRSGHADVALAGGTDALCRLTYSGFNVLQAVDPEPCRPFDRSRSGITLGEGAGYLVIERMEDANARGATMLAELVGYGASCDAHHPTAPIEDGSGAAAAMRAALADGSGNGHPVDYVNAHGTGTPLNDPAETRAIVTVLGEHVPVSSSKSFFGHTLGAAGGLEAVVTVLALMHQVAPPTLRLGDRDPACVLDCIPGVPRAMPMSRALSNTFGFGGSNISVLLSTAGGDAG